MRNICFFLLSFPQNERKICLLCSVSFAQFVHFLREVCLLFNFWVKICQKNHYCEFYQSKLKSKDTSLRKYTNWAKLPEQNQCFLSFWGNERRKKTNILHPSSATPTDATPTEATPSSADTPSALGTLENAKILAKLRCYTCIYKKYTLEEWKKFDNENTPDIVKYLVVAIGSGKDYY